MLMFSVEGPGPTLLKNWSVNNCELTCESGVLVGLTLAAMTHELFTESYSDVAQAKNLH